jgi:hypothetical protein
MQRVPKSIAPLVLTTAAQTAYTAPSGTVSTINNLSLTNTSGSVVTATLYNVPASGSAGVGNEFLAAFSLSPGQTYVPPQAIGLQLAAGSTLQALASANTSITLMGGVYETSGSS